MPPNNASCPGGSMPARFAGIFALATLALAMPVHRAAAQDAPPVPPATPPATPPPLPPPPPNDDSSDKPASHFSFGPEVGVYFPTSAKTKTAFGSSWFNYGLGVGAIKQAHYGGQFQLDLGLFGTSRSGHVVDMAPIGVSYRRALSENPGSTTYVGASADIFLTLIRSDPDGIQSRIRGTQGGSVFIGDTFHKSAYIQARYLVLGSIRGYNLSGLNLSTGYRF